MKFLIIGVNKPRKKEVSIHPSRPFTLQKGDSPSRVNAFTLLKGESSFERSIQIVISLVCTNTNRKWVKMAFHISCDVLYDINF
jgi:hypothetical protein